MATSSVWPTLATKWVGGMRADGVYMPGGLTVPDDPRPIAEPSYFWGGEGGRPIYVVYGPDDWRPDLYRYDVDGVMDSRQPGDVASGATTGTNANGGTVPILPDNVKTAGQLNPIITTASGTQTAAAGGGLGTTLSDAQGRARGKIPWTPLLLAAGALLLVHSPRRY